MIYIRCFCRVSQIGRLDGCVIMGDNRRLMNLPPKCIVMTSSYTHTHSPAHMFPHAMFSPTIHKRADIHRPLVSFVPLPVGSANANAAERKTDDLSVKRGRREGSKEKRRFGPRICGVGLEISMENLKVD